MGASDSIKPLEKRVYPHAECLVGTKAQIQAEGIGVGVPFPGEPSAQPRQITVRDPRGLKARISKAYSWQGAGRYEVTIELKPRNRTPRRTPTSPISVSEGYSWVVYEGTREQLIAQAGARPEWFDEIGTQCMGSRQLKHKASITLEDGRKIEIQRDGRYFRLCYARTDAEQEEFARREENTTEVKRRQDTVKARMECWSASASGYRAHAEMVLEMAETLIDRTTHGHDTGGYLFDPDTIDEIAAHVAAIRAAIAAGTVRHDAEQLASERDRLQAWAIEKDSTFARFRAQVLAK